ncbi:hypothetical protein PENTCL1PPCAC_4884 [Pristionchus entomophagus]|uniref:Uncharacterized protein n=1 Tax=Pristionchus entomophagus TaxID=358040 RepID=A0AAV5SMZ8_9BILA|nr:hypothetical protein PENTCL1PPCAC_4884 [Pristionchus entomophagus]
MIFHQSEQRERVGETRRVVSRFATTSERVYLFPVWARNDRRENCASGPLPTVVHATARPALRSHNGILAGSNSGTGGEPGGGMIGLSCKCDGSKNSED